MNIRLGRNVAKITGEQGERNDIGAKRFFKQKSRKLLKEAGATHRDPA